MKTTFNFIRIGYGVSTAVTWNREARDSYNRLHIPLSNEASVFVNGERNTLLKVGNAYLLPSHVSMGIGGEKRELYEHLYIDFSTSPIVLNKKVTEIDITNDPIIKDFADMLRNRLFEIGKGKYVQLLPSEIPQYLIYFLRSIITYIFDSYEVKQLTNEKLVKAMAYIYEHYSENITNEDIARSVYVHQRQLMRLFKKEFDMTPHQFLTEHRINMAADMLSDEATSIKEVCYKCGFEDRNTFRKAFKKINYVTPSEYMEAAKSKNQKKEKR